MLSWSKCTCQIWPFHTDRNVRRLFTVDQRANTRTQILIYTINPFQQITKSRFHFLAVPPWSGGEHHDSRSSPRAFPSQLLSEGRRPQRSVFKQSAFVFQQHHHDETWALLVTASMDWKSLRHWSSINDSHSWIIDISDSLDYFCQSGSFSSSARPFSTSWTHARLAAFSFSPPPFIPPALLHAKIVSSETEPVSVTSSPSQLIS